MHLGRGVRHAWHSPARPPCPPARPRDYPPRRARRPAARIKHQLVLWEDEIISRREKRLGTQNPHNRPHNHPITHQQHTAPRTSARRPKPRPTQQPQARSRPLPAADSEEAAPSKPDHLPPPAPRAPPRACSKADGSEMKARGAADGVAAPGSCAAGAPDKLISTSRRERRRRACATAAAKPTWERRVEIMKDRASSMERAPSESATDAGLGTGIVVASVVLTFTETHGHTDTNRTSLVQNSLVSG